MFVEDRPQTPSEWEAELAGSRKTIDVTCERGTPDDKAELAVSYTSTANNAMAQHCYPQRGHRACSSRMH